MRRDERRGELDRSPIALDRALFRRRRWFDITSERGYRLGRDGIK
jgi:hypothetical protein